MQTDIDDFEREGDFDQREDERESEMDCFGD